MRTHAKIKEIERYLSELSEFMPTDVNGYKELKTKAACERYFEKITGSVVDLSFLVLKERRLTIPEEDKAVFDKLADLGIITADLAVRLKEARGMRNIIAHEYGRVDDELVFHSITTELARDVLELLASIKKFR
jgi:uncharacterized protein YutE (UPF0331/DUF86 family)